MYCCIDDSSDGSGLFIRREVFPANRVTLPLEPFSTKQLYEKPLLADQITNWPFPLYTSSRPGLLNVGIAPPIREYYFSPRKQA